MSARSVDLDYFSFVTFLAVFTIARLLFKPRIFFDEFFLGRGVIEMKIIIYVVRDFFIAVSLLVAFSLQSENVEILWCFLGTITL